MPLRSPTDEADVEEQVNFRGYEEQDKQTKRHWPRLVIPATEQWQEVHQEQGKGRLSELDQQVEQQWPSVNTTSEELQDVRKVLTSMPRAQTFKRQQSEKRERLAPTSDKEQRGRSVSNDNQKRYRAHGEPLPYSSAPELLTSGYEGLQQDHSSYTAASQSSRSDTPARNDKSEQFAKPKVDEGHQEDLIDMVKLQEEYQACWILNLSMHFRDKSNREKFFITYAQTPRFWRRMTISLDYRGAPDGSLEAELNELHYQRDKSFRIFEALRESLSEIKFYDTVTNLKLVTTPEDMQLHVHVREDANEIIDYPDPSSFDHIECKHYTEEELVFDSHISGFVYKVLVNNRIMIKKEIPGVDTVDEFIYEVNALNALKDCFNVMPLAGLITSNDKTEVKGLLIGYAAKGALVDALYDWEIEELSWEVRLKWARQIIEGLSAIHEAGYVQGDFTLSNIVIDDNEDAHIIDINRRGCPIGWEPPELGVLIGNGHRVSMYIGVKTDLFQLGMVLWAMAELNDEPERCERPLRKLDDSVPDFYRGIVSLCLQERPQKRPSAALLLQMLNNGMEKWQPTVESDISSGACQYGPEAGSNDHGLSVDEELSRGRSPYRRYSQDVLSTWEAVHEGGHQLQHQDSGFDEGLDRMVTSAMDKLHFDDLMDPLPEAVDSMSLGEGPEESLASTNR